MTRPVTARPRGSFGCKVSCRHRGFDAYYGDQATSTFSLAIGVAMQRIRRGRGRQRVTRHDSRVRDTPIWFVQDADATAVRT